MFRFVSFIFLTITYMTFGFVFVLFGLMFLVWRDKITQVLSMSIDIYGTLCRNHRQQREAVADLRSKHRVMVQRDDKFGATMRTSA